MYCKNCGRQLKEGMRFCDRCGHSVRKSQHGGKSAKQQEIEELKAERLNRKKRLAEKEAKQTENRKRKKRKGNTFMFLIIIVLIAVLSVIIGYNIFPKGSVSQPSATGTATMAPVSSPAATPAAKSGYSLVTIGNISCPYPTEFHINPVSGNEKLNATDPLGGATMQVAQEGKGGVPKDMMAEYAAQGSNVTYSRAGNDWYAITLEIDGKINHRKCIIRNGISIYYDFTYEESSSSVKRYEDHISYIDSNFK